MVKDIAVTTTVNYMFKFKFISLGTIVTLCRMEFAIANVQIIFSPHRSPAPER